MFLVTSKVRSSTSIKHIAVRRCVPIPATCQATVSVVYPRTGCLVLLTNILHYVFAIHFKLLNSNIYAVINDTWQTTNLCVCQSEHGGQLSPVGLCHVLLHFKTLLQTFPLQVWEDSTWPRSLPFRLLLLRRVGLWRQRRVGTYNDNTCTITLAS